MATVEIVVAGRPYQLACRPEDAADLKSLALLVDEKAAQARQVLGGGASEGRLLLLTAMMLADELRDAVNAAPPPAPAPAPNDERDAQIAEAIESIAERLESIAEGLEGGARAP